MKWVGQKETYILWESDQRRNFQGKGGKNRDREIEETKG